MKKKIPVIILLLLFWHCSNNPVETKSTLENTIKEFVQAEMDKYNIPGIQIAVENKNTGERINVSMGVSDIEKKIMMNDFTQIKVGSITKSFTALSILKLAKNGKLNLDDELGNYFNFGDSALQQITIKQLMNMNSGLRCYINDDESEFIVNTVIDYPARHFEPEELVNHGIKITNETGLLSNSDFHYNNTNYILLGMIIEKVSKVKYAGFIASEITDELKLASTFIPTDNLLDNNIASGYYINHEEEITTNYSSLNLSYVWSAGAIISTASDLCKFITSIANDDFELGEQQNEIYEGHAIAENVSYTAGLINENDKLWHNGSVIGYHGEMCFLKSKETAVVVLTNCNVTGIEGDPVKVIINKIIELVNKNY